MDTLLHRLRTLIGMSGGDALADGQLLERFAVNRDEAAFELLVRRHGPLVWNVCQRILGNSTDSDDAFQAVFLVLVRKAAGLDRRGPLAPWLYGVASRVALRARTQRQQRREREQQVVPNYPQATDPDVGELRALLDEELSRLPAKYRSALVLCDLEGRTHEEAARQLSWPLGTLKCRVQRGREQLRQRLTRRGLVLSAAMLGASLTIPETPAQVPPVLLESTIRAALEYAAGQPVAAAVTALAEGVLHTMNLARIKIAAGVLFTATLLGGGWTTYRVWSTPAPAEQAAPQESPAEDWRSLEKPWAELASADGGEALRALRVLARDAQGTRFVIQRLKGMGAPDVDIAQMIADLDSPEFARREKASQTLERVVDSAAPHLQKVLDGKPSVELQRRVEQLLSRRQGAQRERQAARAVALLEVTGGRGVLQALRELRNDAADGPVARETGAALKRLAAKTPPTDPSWKELLSDDPATVARAFLTLERQRDEDSATAQQIAPSLRLADGLPPLLFTVRLRTSQELPHELLPYRAETLKKYGSDVELTPLRSAIVDGVKALDSDSKSPEPPIREQLLTPNAPALIVLKKNIELYQKEKIGEALFGLGKVIEELEARQDSVAKEPLLWQAYYTYVLAHLYARQASLLEYTAALGSVRRDDLPPLDPKGHQGWRLSPRKDMRDKDGKEMVDRAHKLLDELARKHAGTPWELIARRERNLPFGLEWLPLEK
jgi:RNA polymerase sigma factor (sigma-70 family)